MPRHPIELARKHYEGLPAVLKQALFSTDVSEKMFEIGKKFGLTIEKTGIMAEETGYVMLGLGRPNEFVGNLAKGLQIDKDKATDMSAEINHQIFFPLREELRRAHDFDMEMGEIAGSADTSRISGMQMPANVKKTFVQEKSPLVADLTRVKEQSLQQAPQASPRPAQPLPSFVPSAAPTNRIADLQKMSEKQPLIAQPKEIPELTSPVPVTPAPLMVPPLQRPAAPPPLPIQSKLPPIDLRKNIPPVTPPAAKRTTPQLHDKAPLDNDTIVTLLEEKMMMEPRRKPPPVPSTAAPTTPLTPSVNASTSSDPYREPVDE